MEYFGIARWAWELYDYSYTSYKVISTFTGCCKGEECIITAALKYISVWGIFLLLLRHQRCKWLFSHSQQHVKKWWNTQKSTSTTRSTGRTAGSYFSSWSSALSKHQQYISPGAECNCGIFAQVMAHQPLMIPRISHRQFSFFFLNSGEKCPGHAACWWDTQQSWLLRAGLLWHCWKLHFSRIMMHVRSRRVTRTNWQSRMVGQSRKKYRTKKI
jgi:hypothetical protein